MESWENFTIINLFQEFVTAYIKAYYIPESDLETWVQQHTEYSNKQLVALGMPKFRRIVRDCFELITIIFTLVNSVAYNNNKTKQKLNNIINDLSDRIRR